MLASRVRVKSYEDVSFVHPHSQDVTSALASAEDRFIYIDDDEEYNNVDIIDSYLNGPQTLSKDRLSTLVVADRGEAAASEGQSGQRTIEFMLLATHFLGDGMALHTFMNEFYTLLGSDKSSQDLIDMIAQLVDAEPAEIPASLEERLPSIGNGSRFARSIGRIDNKRNDSRLLGGQSFPSNRVKMPRKTVVPTFPYTAEETKRILAKCKENGVTIAHAMFALCNVAWARRTTSSKVDPCLIYSALNLRPNMIKSPSVVAEPSFFHLAVGYFNIVLPTVIPSDLTTSELFWHRARSTKSQTIRAVRSDFVVARSREGNLIRRERAVKWAKVDDEEERKKHQVKVMPNGGIGLGLGFPLPMSLPQLDGRAAGQGHTRAHSGERPGPKFAPVRANADTPMASPMISPPPSRPTSSHSSMFFQNQLESMTAANAAKLPPASTKALMGLSMLGNLDGMYKHASFPAIKLERLTTGSRQRAGGLLLFAYTFAGKLWLSLGYDVNGFEEGVIEGFWDEMQVLVREVMM